VLNTLSVKNARKLILLSQGVHRTSDFGRGEPAIENVAERLGYIQIDTISVVERAHHHVLWSRAPCYKPQQQLALKGHCRQEISRILGLLILQAGGTGNRLKEHWSIYS